MISQPQKMNHQLNKSSTKQILYKNACNIPIFLDKKEQWYVLNTKIPQTAKVLEQFQLLYDLHLLASITDITQYHLTSTIKHNSTAHELIQEATKALNLTDTQGHPLHSQLCHYVNHTYNYL